MLSQAVKDAIASSVLCWLATSKDNQPNVSPKEIFTSTDDGIIIANIASPQSVENIKHNDAVCVSFIDIFEQKGYKVYGTASIVTPGSPNYASLFNRLSPMVGDKFTILSIIKVIPTKIQSIVAPSYIFYPDVKKEAMIESAKQTYLHGK